MFSLRGDAHKIYLKLKKASNIKYIKEIKEVEEIQKFYHSIDSDSLKRVYFRMIKEKNGSGMIPLLVTSCPWLLLIFSKQLQGFLFKDGSFLWIFFVFLYILVLAISVILHFHEKSWAYVHTEIIQDILEERKDSS